MDNTLSKLREHLFDVLERVKEGNDPDCDAKDTIDLDRARVINKTAQSIINAAKVEVEGWKIIADNGDFGNDFKNSGLLKSPGKVNKDD